ncbi:MAG: small-conductance mechanosensitive channel [Actinobacteria bacterium]|jgi:moderate conductance mechanosensitive channel|nr:small-conductance mechanosensitive channel [Actinomycetota bacterium]
MNSAFDQFAQWFSGAPLRIATVVLIALIVQFSANRAIIRSMNKLIAKTDRGTENRAAERARTIGALLKSTVNALTFIVAGAMILDQLGLNLGPLLTSAGVVGVALGLGAQTIVRDILSGLSMLIEDQYGVGDRVELLEISGVVENVGMRITTIRDDKGVLWYLRNGEILKVGNHSQ